MPKSNTTRRDFLKTSAMVSIPFALGGFPLYSTAKPGNNNIVGNDKILVLVQLQGGNDGLSTIYHAPEYANLAAVRNNILVPDTTILNFHNDYGFHPSMQGMKDMWDAGTLGIVQNVGYPNQNRSHFRSTDIWNSASDAAVYEPKGWIGRFYDLNHSNYPNGYPNADCPHPFALTMGKIVSETCQGANTNYSLSLLDPFNPGTALVSAGGNIPADCYGDALTFVNNTIAQTNAYAQVISDAANAGNNLSSKWNSLTTELSAKLKNVARLISGGLETKVYIVQLGGFDTHDNQTVDLATDTGIHSDLLLELSDALCAFQEDLTLLGVDDRVIGMTYSEFGRRIRSNSALGTDHGDAAPMFMFGSCVENHILGTHPVIDPMVDIETGVAMEYDFRDVYGTVLNQWLGLDEADVMNLIYPGFTALPLLQPSCNQANPPICDQPTGATVSAGSTTATLTWDPEPDALQTQIQYRIHPSNGGGSQGTDIVGAGVTSHTITGLLPGSQYQLRFRHNCGFGMSDWRFKPFITASLKEGKTEKRISFSPNPSNGKMNIEHNLSRIDKIEVSDILGKTVYAQNSYSERKLDLSHLSSGQYVVRIFSAGNVFTRKIILK